MTLTFVNSMRTILSISMDLNINLNVNLNSNDKSMSKAYIKRKTFSTSDERILRAH
jgi:hypothetical protein